MVISNEKLIKALNKLKPEWWVFLSETKWDLESLDWLRKIVRDYGLWGTAPNYLS